jgi:hypothetical protein
MLLSLANGCGISTRRVLQGSLTTIALALPFTAAAQFGHEHGRFLKSYAGPWQLHSTASGLDLAVYADFLACRQAATTGPDMACRPVSMPASDVPTPPVVQPDAVVPPVMNGAFPVDASHLPNGDSGFRLRQGAADERSRARVARHRRVPHPVRLFAHGVRRPDRVSGAPGRIASPHFLRQHRNQREQHGSVDRHLRETRRASAARSIARPTGCRR